MKEIIEIIEKLKRKKEEAKEDFVRNSITKRECQENNQPAPVCDNYLDKVIGLEEVISKLEYLYRVHLR